MALDQSADGAGPHGVSVRALGSDMMLLLAGYLQNGGAQNSVLRVSVGGVPGCGGEDLPDVAGRYRLLDDGLQFCPHFPFEPGVSYRASFDPRPLCGSDSTGALTLDFRWADAMPAPAAEVERVYPTADVLPENLLRFYVCFSNPMRRGLAGAEIELLGTDGTPAHDVLYRAPVELWDRSMRVLTVLLDPGRLKRGVGPNRALGPPLQAGETYTLMVGAGMMGMSGGQLGGAFCKPFRVAPAVREPVAVTRWTLEPPVCGTLHALILLFPAPLDWAMLLHAIAVVSADGQAISGHVTVDQCERRWCFTPASPWEPGGYEVRVAAGLEDVCGNNLAAAFDRPFRPGGDLAGTVPVASIAFQLG